jgi:FAD:protein FMN transferase
MIKIEFQAMGCRVAAFLDNESQAAANALRQVPLWFEEWEQALSRFRPDSDLNQLNASAGTPAPVDPIVWDVVQAALANARWTGGLVVPTVLGALLRAGYDRSFDLLKASLPDTQENLIPQTGELPGLDASIANWRDILLDDIRRTIYLPAGVKLDLGGVGKGWAAWQAMERLRDFGPALADAGGDIAVSSLQLDGSPWPVAVVDPLQIQESLDLLALDGCGVATSGIDYRHWMKDGAWKHHIIDPRTGEPANTNLMSVTVVASDTLQAEAAAKTVLILGSQAGLDWLEEQYQVAGFLALQDGRLLYSRGMDQYLWS